MRTEKIDIAYLILKPPVTQPRTGMEVEALFTDRKAVNTPLEEGSTKGKDSCTEERLRTVVLQ